MKWYGEIVLSSVKKSYLFLRIPIWYSEMEYGSKLLIWSINMYLYEWVNLLAPLCFVVVCMWYWIRALAKDHVMC